MRIQNAIGEYVHECRTTYNLTLDQIATESRRYGSNWNSGSIKKLEGGQVAATLENMLIIARTINSLTNGDISLADMFSDDDSVDLGDRIVESDEIRRTLNGSSVLFEVSANSDVRSRATEVFMSSMPEIMQQVSTAIIGSLPDDDWGRADAHEPSLAEHRAAKKLGITPVAVAALCLTRYGRFLDDEAARRAGDGASPQKRGRETRGIVEELDLLLEEMMNSESHASAPGVLSEEERKRRAIADLNLAANDNPDKEAESEYFADEGA
jgi:hypothetical protein